MNKNIHEKMRAYNQHFSSEATLKSVSEREVARIFEEELYYYRSIEKLKKDFQKTHPITLRDLFKLIDYRKKRYLDFESLSGFMARIKVLFNKDEFWALLRRIAINLDTQIESQELIYALFPNEPYEYPAFREKFHFVNALEKAQEFGYTSTHEFNNFGTMKKPLSYKGSSLRQQSSLKFLKDPLSSERKNFIYDQSYHKHYHDYKATFIEPSKDLSYNYQKKTLGIRGMDDFFGDYYYYLNDREKSEEFFNKYGKRYVYENSLETVEKKITEPQDKVLVDTFRYTINKESPLKKKQLLDH